MWVLRRRHDHDRGRARRDAARRPAACAQRQPLPLHRLSLDQRCACRHRRGRGRYRRPRLRRQPAEPVRRGDRDRQGPLHHGHRGRGHAPHQGAALAPCPRAYRVDRPQQGPGGAGGGRGLHLGGCAAPALQHGHPRGPPGRSRRLLCARQCGALRRPARRRGRRRDRGPGRARLPASRRHVRHPARGVRSRRCHGPGRAHPPPEGRRGERQHLRRHPRRGRQREGRLRRRRRRARDDLLDLAGAARAPGDPRLDCVARRGWPIACAHQHAGAFHCPAETLPHLRAAGARPPRLHRAGRRRLRRQAGDDLGGSLPARHDEARAPGEVGVHPRGAVYRRHHPPPDDHQGEARRQARRHVDRNRSSSDLQHRWLRRPCQRDARGLARSSAHRLSLRQQEGDRIRSLHQHGPGRRLPRLRSVAVDLRHRMRHGRSGAAPRHGFFRDPPQEHGAADRLDGVGVEGSLRHHVRQLWPRPVPRPRGAGIGGRRRRGQTGWR